MPARLRLTFDSVQRLAATNSQVPGYLVRFVYDGGVFEDVMTVYINQECPPEDVIRQAKDRLLDRLEQLHRQYADWKLSDRQSPDGAA